MSNFGTKVITGRLPYSVPITYFIELFTKFSSAGSCYYIQTLRSWQGDKLQNITHTVTELLHLYSSCLPRPTGANILQSLSQSFPRHIFQWQNPPLFLAIFPTRPSKRPHSSHNSPRRPQSAGLSQNISPCWPIILTCDNVHHHPVGGGVGGEAGVVAAVQGQGLVYHQAALQLRMQHCSGQLHPGAGLQHSVVHCPVNHCSLHVSRVSALATEYVYYRNVGGDIVTSDIMGQTSGPRSTLQTSSSPWPESSFESCEMFKR